MKVLCFDIGGTSVKYGVCEDGMLLEKSSFATNASLGQLHMSQSLKNITREYLLKYPDIEGVGVSTTGSVDVTAGRILVHPNVLPYFKNWDFKKVFSEFHLDCVADNDVNSFAVAECHAQKRKDLSNYMVITIGTGIGGAVVVNGKVQRGATWNCGEVGRMFIEPNVSWEELGSITGLVKLANENGMNVTEGNPVCFAVDNKDELATRIMNRWIQYVAIGIYNLIVIFNPEAIIIGGGISHRSSFIDGVKDEVNRILPDGFKNTCNILPASFYNDGGLIGAFYNFQEFGKKRGIKNE